MMGVAREAARKVDPAAGGADALAVQTVIFDCDGVMFDTAGVNRAYYNHLLARFGRPEINAAQFDFVHMHTVDEAVDYLFADAKTRREAMAYRAGLDYRPFLEHLVIEPGLRALLRRLRPACKTAVATNRTDTMDELLRRYELETSFDMVVRACDVARPKPHPDPLLRILDTFGIAAGQAVYIGDSSVDATAAAAAGVPFIAYRNPALKALRHIRRLTELESLLVLPRP